MAGELPGAGDARKKKQQNNKKPLRWQDDKSTDKIYASKQVSALGQNRSVADSTLKPGQEPAGIKTPVMKADDKSADKYYAEGGSQRPRVGAAGQKKLGPAPQLGVPKKGEKPRRAAGGKLLVQAKEDISGVMEQVVDLLNGGNDGIVVYIQAGDSGLLRRTRAALDLLVTREKISEDMSRDVRLSYELSADEQAGVAEKLGVPTAKETVRTEENETAVVDPLDFLNGLGGADPEDPVVDTSPITDAQDVDTSGDTTTEVVDEDDDDNDFLKPKVEEVVAAPPVVDQVFTPDAAEVNLGAPVEAPVEEATPKKRSRRSGRGSD